MYCKYYNREERCYSWVAKTIMIIVGKTSFSRCTYNLPIQLTDLNIITKRKYFILGAKTIMITVVCSQNKIYELIVGVIASFSNFMLMSCREVVSVSACL